MILYQRRPLVKETLLAQEGPFGCRSLFVSSGAARSAASAWSASSNKVSWVIVGPPGPLQRQFDADHTNYSRVSDCRRTISLIQIGAKGEVHPLETG